MLSRREAIEAAAIAIREQVAARLSHHHNHPKPWNALPETLKDSYRAEAKAALEAVGAI